MSAPYHVVLPAPYSQPGDYLVGHATPGLPGCYTVDASCLTPASAKACADHLNEQRACGAAHAYVQLLMADVAAQRWTIEGNRP